MGVIFLLGLSLRYAAAGTEEEDGRGRRMPRPRYAGRKRRFTVRLPSRLATWHTLPCKSSGLKQSSAIDQLWGCILRGASWVPRGILGVPWRAWGYPRATLGDTPGDTLGGTPEHFGNRTFGSSLWGTFFLLRVGSRHAASYPQDTPQDPPSPRIPQRKCRAR